MYKSLEKGSKYVHLDVNNDGTITDEEMARAKEIAEFEHNIAKFENEDKKEDQIRNMAWFALFGMLLYPSLVVLSTFIGLDKAASILGDMAATYFVSVAAIVAAFFGKEAYVKSKNAEVSIKK